ncbi:MAG: hypothetical protein CVT67_01605 [Actinobacteria bacterium HGW-Actinobacteria-7]|jgi:tetratricopeptide (TPR) repeat protein|nr:MAG: hypothetical protein CVT67_01605 [Actinobacteria bacterium HGW-Actinobacteria-7]
MADASSLPKVKRANRRTTVLTWAFLGTFIVVLAVIIGLLLTGTLFNTEPKTDTERDYQLLLDGLKRNPKNAALLMTLAETEWDLGRKGDARSHAEKAIANGAKESGIQLRYAQLMIKDNKLDIATKAVERELVVTEYKAAEPYFLLAQIQAEQKKYDEAIKTMDKGLKIIPTAADMRVTYGEILEKADKKKRAIAQYTEALKYLPGNEDAIAGLKRLGAPIPAPAESPHGQ